ncbi:hypothetical protein D920_00499 [Enterococcus faecalis 13-SD-W-01]|nr:hypothetical protein D920_00499 [Enterococcus faecalis 13-SD-W-01]
MEMTVIVVAEEIFFAGGGSDLIMERPIHRDKQFKLGGLLLYRAINSEHDVVAEERYRIDEILLVDGIKNTITLRLLPLDR